MGNIDDVDGGGLLMPCADALKVEDGVAALTRPDGRAHPDEDDTDHAFVVRLEQLLDDVGRHLSMSGAALESGSPGLLALRFGSRR